MVPNVGFCIYFLSYGFFSFSYLKIGDFAIPVSYFWILLLADCGINGIFCIFLLFFVLSISECVCDYIYDYDSLLSNN
jgi:hypothetical protein